MPGHPKAFSWLGVLMGFTSGCLAAPSPLSAIYATQLNRSIGQPLLRRGLRIFRAAENTKPRALVGVTECAMKGPRDGEHPVISSNRQIASLSTPEILLLKFQCRPANKRDQGLAC